MAAVKFDTIRVVLYSSIGATYSNFGSALTQNWRMFRIVNQTNGNLMVTTNTSVDQLFLAANSFVLYDCATNAVSVNNSDWFVLPIGTQFSVRYITAPTSGSVYLEGVFSTGV
jgi:hypothetical protein